MTQSMEVTLAKTDTYVEALGIQIEDPHPLNRMSAAVALGNARPGDAMVAAVALASRLDDGNAAVRKHVEVALGKLGEAGTAAVASRLIDGDREVRRSAALTLGRMGKNAAPYVGVLAHRLTDSDDWVRRTAADALGSLGGAAAPHAATVAKRLNDRDDSVRRSAVAALGRIGPAGAKHAGAIAGRLEGDGHAGIHVRAEEALRRMHEAGPVANNHVSRLTTRKPLSWNSMSVTLPQ